MHSRRVLSFFFANRTRAPHGEVLGLMKPLSSSSCSWTLSSYNSTGAILYGVIEIGEVPGCNLIPKSTTLCGGNPGSSSEKNPHTRKLLEVDLSPVSSRPLGQGLLANPPTVLDTWTRTLYEVNYHACPPEIQHEYRPTCRR